MTDRKGIKIIKIKDWSDVERFVNDFTAHPNSAKIRNCTPAQNLTANDNNSPLDKLALTRADLESLMILSPIAAVACQTPSPLDWKGFEFTDTNSTFRVGGPLLYKLNWRQFADDVFDKAGRPRQSLTLPRAVVSPTCTLNTNTHSCIEFVKKHSIYLAYHPKYNSIIEILLRLLKKEDTKHFDTVITQS